MLITLAIRTDKDMCAVAWIKSGMLSLMGSLSAKID